MAHFERAINEKRFCQSFSSQSSKSFQFYPRANCNRGNCTGKDCEKKGWYNHPGKPICWSQFCGIHPAQDVKNRHVYPTVALEHARDYVHPVRTEEGLFLSESEREEAFITSIKALWTDEQMYRKAPDDNISPPTPLRISFLEFFRIPINEVKPPPKVKAPRPKHQAMPIPKANTIPFSPGRFGILQQTDLETANISHSQAKPPKAGPQASTAKAASPPPKADSASPPPKAKAEPVQAKKQGKAKNLSKDGTLVIDVTSKKNSKLGITEFKVVEVSSGEMSSSIEGDRAAAALAAEKTDDLPLIPGDSVASTFISNVVSGTEPITADIIIPKLPSDEDEIDKMLESMKKSNEELKAAAEAAAKAKADLLRIEAKKNELAQCIMLQRQLLQATEMVKANHAEQC